MGRKETAEGNKGEGEWKRYPRSRPSYISDHFAKITIDNKKIKSLLFDLWALWGMHDLGFKFQ